MNPQQQPATPPPVADPRQQVLEQIKTSTNVLLTVSENPTVDQLAAIIGMTLLLNKLGKHATAVFSGQIPSTIQFLQPEKTIEKTTDSLRDFIIALDKSKADKLRYKIEDKYVKIFITPYHTSLTDKDLEFSQGDYNVDVVLALGVKKRDELDKTIIEHGRILHDATVVSINNAPGADLGAINWIQTGASGLSEMMVGLVDDLKTEQQPKIVDEQIATCFLTGIVAQTDRFSNAKTNPQTMSLAAKLMNAGANQQLIATKLEPPAPIPKEPEKVNKPEPPKPVVAPAPPKPVPPPAPPKPPTPAPAAQPPPGPVKLPHMSHPQAAKPAEKPKESQDGALLVPHDGVTGDGVSYSNEPEENIAKIHIDDEGILKRIAEEEAAKQATVADQPSQDSVEAGADGRKMISQPPTMGGEVNATDSLQTQNDTSDPLSAIAPATTGPTLSHGVPGAQAEPSAPVALPQTKNDDTLSDIEQAVNSPHIREVDSSSDINTSLPTSLIGPDLGLPPDLTAGNPNPSAPPPVPPPMTIAPPSNGPPGNMSNPNSGIPL